MNPLLHESDRCLALAQEGSELLARLNTVWKDTSMPLRWCIAAGVEQATAHITEGHVLYCLHEFPNETTETQRRELRSCTTRCSYPSSAC